MTSKRKLTGAMADPIKRWPVGERPRERLLAHGAERLTDAELLAVTLRVGQGTFRAGMPGRSALALARSLLVDFKGLRGLDRASVTELGDVPGVSVAKIAQVKAAFELGKRLLSRRSKPRSFASATGVAAYMRPRIARARNETVVALLLDGQNHLLDEEEISSGTPTQSGVYVRRVLEAALRASAAAIVLVHNHPSGNAAPSAADDATTRDLEKAAATVGLVLVDHIIIGDEIHYSYANSGRLEVLRG